MNAKENSNSQGALSVSKNLLMLLSLALAVAATAAVVLAVVQLTNRPGIIATGPSGSPAASTPGQVVSDAPLTQTDKIDPAGSSMGVVYYPLPFATTPNLKLVCAKRRYLIFKQDEFGFTWDAGESADPDVQTKEKADSTRKVVEEFTWEAKGVRGDPAQITFEQSGTFQTGVGQKGEVYFPSPYGSPPNVTLDTSTWNATVIAEVTPNGFKWVNSGKEENFNNARVKWVAKGTRSSVPMTK